MRWNLSFAACVSLKRSAAQGQQRADLVFSPTSVLPASVLQADSYIIPDRVLVSANVTVANQSTYTEGSHR